MRFFRLIDYSKIKSNDLSIASDDNEATRFASEDTAEGEIKSYLSQRFDVALMFAVINEFDFANQYSAGARIEWLEDGYDNDESYLVGNRVSFNGKIYTNIQDSQGTDPDNELFWTDIGDQSGLYSRIGIDDSSGHLPNDGNFWTKGDSRDAQIKTYFEDISLFHLHPNLSERVIPDLRQKRYDDAISWLKKVAKGDIQTEFPLLLDSEGEDQGDNITFDSNEKLNHSY